MMVAVLRDPPHLIGAVGLICIDAHPFNSCSACEWSRSSTDAQGRGNKFTATLPMA